MDKIYDLDIARNTIKKFCAYQERSQKQVRERLQKMGLIEDAINLLISECIQENYLNEERFARAFVRGKHKIKKWGRKRLELELKKHEVSDYVMRKAMSEIDDDSYDDQLQELAEKRWNSVTEPNRFKKGKKVVDYLLRRGYESSAVWEVVHSFINQSPESDE
ncbi:MAG: RecX family transcriptional regulator [Bacteroidetes bacterium]|uniref:Regulatory protein RecX n=1 Tax=Phaeocystidibacter marisrubri TaxID=1577780 RepID=A0A6L3ZDG6_9FLAO|nr:regulatory protein RecX [Phaeocystidibacter marisrubri]KAB2815883.1 RecX family transcriptional regulator [Phaeocystidibacter marisrubri]TNE30727.1 MAG: RecX family transcriptional regulator [Bacteroidota bacterium]GGH66213.1 recombinase RecX [Phaeocystidibacter marisrubri]